MTKTKLITALIAATAVGAGVTFGVYKFTEKESTPTPTVIPSTGPTPGANVSVAPPTSAPNAAEIKQRVRTFYTSWLSKQTDAANHDTLAAQQLKQGVLTQRAADAIKARSGYDLVTCSQSPLTINEYRFADPTISGDAISMVVSGTYPGPPPHDVAITLRLVNTGGNWAIDGFTCAAPLT